MNAANSPAFVAPHPGTPAMPRWHTAELPEAPTFTARNWLGMIGPGLVMGAAAIGGGEWLLGPAVTAKYGGALLWVATCSILVQVVYNLEICRYTLYTGEPIFTGKFRTLPGPWFWLVVYLLFDWGTLLPYLAANAAQPLGAMLRGAVLDSSERYSPDWWLQKQLATLIFLACMVPLVMGGKVYRSLKVVMSFKLVFVLGFLLFLGILYSRPASWWEIVSGFAKMGTVPVLRGEDTNGNGQLDAGEDFDGDGRLDVVEKLERDPATNAITAGDRDGDGKEDGANVENLFLALWHRGEWPDVDFTLIAYICGLAAIAGNGGLTNTPISNFTRDQGWGMGHHVGAIPSVIGGQGIALSHVGCVFEVNEESLPRWRRWRRHVLREQLGVWMLACFLGVALPSILSVEFLPRGTPVSDWKLGVMTAQGVGDRVASPIEGTLVHTLGLHHVFSGASWGRLFWYGTLFCGFLVLFTSNITTMDGFVRRWVDVFWTASRRLRELDVRYIRYVYFTVLCGYCAVGLVMIWLLEKPGFFTKLTTTGYNFVFALSCWHTVGVNTVLLPAALRPSWATRAFLIVGGCLFLFMGAMQLTKLLAER